MTPQVPSVLYEMAGLLGRNVDPGVADADRAHALRMSAGLLAMAAERWDVAAHQLVAENRALAALLPDTAAEDDLRVAALKRENDRLRVRLIDAHVAAEQKGDAERLDVIWAELIASTERRRLSNEPN